MIIAHEAFSPATESEELVRQTVDSIRHASLELPVWFEYFASTHLHRIAFDVELVRREVHSGARVLDIGALPLMLTESLARSNFEVTGLDIAPERLADAIAAFKLNVVKCNIESQTVPMPDGYFQAVVINEVFEHLRINLIETLSEIARVMAVGGRLLMSTPNHLSYRNILHMLKTGRSMTMGVYDEFEKLQTYGAMGHVREYAPGDVVDFLARMGFRIDKLIYRGRYGTNVAQAIVRLLPNMRPYFTVVATRIA